MTGDFLPPSKEIIERVRAEFGLDERSIREAVDMLKEWLLLQPHLPKEGGKYTSSLLCTTFLHIHDYLHVYTTSLFAHYSTSKITVTYYSTAV